MINTYDFCKTFLRFTDDEINKNEKIRSQEMDKNKILKYLKDTYKPGCIFIDLVNNVKFEVDDNAIINDYATENKPYFYISVKPTIGYNNKTARVFELIDNKEVYAEIVKFIPYLDLSKLEENNGIYRPKISSKPLAVQMQQMIGRQKRDSNNVINIIDISQLNTIYHIKLLSTIKTPLLSNKISKQNNLNNIKIINKK